MEEDAEPLYIIYYEVKTSTGFCIRCTIDKTETISKPVASGKFLPPMINFSSFDVKSQSIYL